ncbi:MAG: hypothetical protein OEV15_04425 [Gallionella sp.]|nr:hypothetical protein [Gallionella sp.]
MASMDDRNAGAETGGRNERRVQHGLRLTIDKACQMVAPLFGSGLGWGSATRTILARETLRAAHPNLSQQELAIMFSAVSQFHNRHPRK